MSDRVEITKRDEVLVTPWVGMDVQVPLFVKAVLVRRFGPFWPSEAAVANALTIWRDGARNRSDYYTRAKAVHRYAASRELPWR